MNDIGDRSIPEDDPLSTADPLATFDPSQRLELAGDTTTPMENPARPIDEPEVTIDQSPHDVYRNPHDDSAIDATIDFEDEARLRETCDRFESAWEHGKQEPQVADFIPPEMELELQRLLVQQLLPLDLKHRKQKSKSQGLEEYLAALPEWKEAVESVFSRRRRSSLGRGHGSVTSPQSTQLRDSELVRTDDLTSRYRPTQLHARGGLGVVFRARDQELKRTVALKEILPKHAADLKCQDRFVFEAEVTGSLEHPGIVPVYGLGRYQDQRPYYAMRFIRGRSFREVIEEFHRNHASPRSTVYFGREFRSLLRRLIDTCNAIHYAHEHGVIHRDIKPANVMVGNYGETLVVDWGLAKLIDGPVGSGTGSIASTRIEVSGSGSHTSQGSAVGTPMYMSPEQANGLHDRLDARADVYSLGAVLFNILTGDHPVKGTTGREIVMQVRAGQIRPVRDLAPNSPRALVSITLKAMAFHPQDRYPTPVALAEDLDRWMSDEAVEAHRGKETVTERAGRLIRRYRGWTLSGAAALVAISIISVVAAVLINDARQREEIARQQASLAKEDAVERYRDSLEAIDTWLVQSSDALEYFPGTQSVRQRLLELATDDYERLSQRSSEDPKLELEHGRALAKLGDLLRRREQHQAALQRYGNALLVLNQYADTPGLESQFAAEAANVRTRRALALAGIDRIADARAELDRAIAQLVPLVESQSSDQAELLLGAAHFNRGELEWLVGEPGDAKNELQTSLSYYQRVDSEDAVVEELAIARIAQRLGDIDADAGDQLSAIGQFQKAIAILTSLVESAPDEPGYLESLAAAEVSLAESYRTLGRCAELFVTLQSAAGRYRALLQAMPDVPRYEENYALTLTDLGIAYHEAGENDDAETVLRDSRSRLLELSQAYGTVPRFRQRLAGCEDALGMVLLVAGENPKEAAAMLSSATMRYQELFQRTQLVPADESGEAAEEMAALRADYVEAIAVAQSHYARSLQRLGDTEQAREYFAGAIDLLERLIAARDQPRYRNALAHVHYRLGLLLHEIASDAAAEHVSTARELWVSLGDARTASYAHDLAWMLAVWPAAPSRDLDAARRYAEEAVALSPDNPRYLSTAAMAELLTDTPESMVSAAAMLDRVRQLRSGEQTDRDLLVLALFSHLQGRNNDAATHLSAAARWQEQHRPFDSDSTLLRDLVAENLEKEGE